MKVRTHGDKTVANGDGSITEELTEFVDATTEALEQTQAPQEYVDTVETAGRELLDAVGSTTVDGEQDHVDGDHHDVDLDERDDTVDGEQHVEEDTTVDGNTPGEEDNLHERVSDLENKASLLTGDVANLEVDTRDLDDRVSDLEDRERTGRPQGSDGGNTDAGLSVEPQTPLENLASLPVESTKDQRANVRRALFVARDVMEYTKKVPKGRAITWSELQTVIYAGTDASHSQDVSRVMEVLATFGQEYVEMVDRPDRPKLVCFDEEAATRLDRLCSDVDSTNDVVSRAKG